MRRPGQGTDDGSMGYGSTGVPVDIDVQEVKVHNDTPKRDWLRTILGITGIFAFIALGLLAVSLLARPNYEGTGAPRPMPTLPATAHQDPVPGCMLDGEFYEGTCPPDALETYEPDPTDKPDGDQEHDYVSLAPDDIEDLLPKDLSHDRWTIHAAADIDGEDYRVRDWLERLCNPAPRKWPSFPNEPNKRVPDTGKCSFQVSNGAEYGVPMVPYCPQDDYCNFPVPSRHFRLITADYSFLGRDCSGGCLLLLINVSDSDWIWEDQHAKSGFSVPGRYFNGDKLEQAAWALVSHHSAQMLNLNTEGLKGEVLNTEGGTNAGGNCGTYEGCEKVNAFIVVHAQDRIIATAETNVTR